MKFFILGMAMERSGRFLGKIWMRIQKILNFQMSFFSITLSFWLISLPKVMGGSSCKICMWIIDLAKGRSAYVLVNI